MTSLDPSCFNLTSIGAPPYRFKLGEADMAVISDGPLELGSPDLAFKGTPADEVRDRLARNFLPTETISIAMNILCASLNGKRVIFETGVGSSKIFGDKGGQLEENLVRAGIDPASIDAVVCSHPHPDHIGGLCDDQGRARFPNAAVYLPEKDYLFWTDEKHLASPIGFAIQIARTNLMPLRDRLMIFKDGEEFLPGIEAVFTPGHTAEHSSFRLCAGEDTLFLIGDLAHHSILLLEDPSSRFYADLDQLQAVQTRIKTLTMLAKTRTRVFSCHFGWPGLGHVAAQDGGFRYFPDEIRW